MAVTSAQAAENGSGLLLKVGEAARLHHTPYQIRQKSLVAKILDGN
jgi:hypothetical protein